MNTKAPVPSIAFVAPRGAATWRVRRGGDRGVRCSARGRGLAHRAPERDGPVLAAAALVDGPKCEFVSATMVGGAPQPRRAADGFPRVGANRLGARHFTNPLQSPSHYHEAHFHVIGRYPFTRRNKKG